MGAREDFEAMRRAAVDLTGLSGPAASPILSATAGLLWRASSRETDFIRLAKAGIQEELVDLAYAVLDEKRPGGSAVEERDQAVSA